MISRKIQQNADFGFCVLFGGSNVLVQQRIFEGNEPRQKVSDLEEEAIKDSRVRQPGLVARW